MFGVYGFILLKKLNKILFFNEPDGGRAVNEPNEHEQSYVHVRSLRKLTCS
ncbi:hypothetical protein Hanom_Chr15g01394091 [Helianthus anomalus]